MGRHTPVNVTWEAKELLPDTEASAVAMPMMQVRIVRMLVSHRLVPV